MDPALGRRLEPEVLHGIGDVDVAAVDPGVAERLVQHPPGRTDERLALAVLLVTRLFPDHDHAGGLRAFTEHRLRGRLPEFARPAAGRGPAQPVEPHALGRLCDVVAITVVAITHAPMTPHDAVARERAPDRSAACPGAPFPDVSSGSARRVLVTLRRKN